jgi:hypothetical protein
MTKQSTVPEELEEAVEDEALMEVDPGDYGFVISSDGELKHMFTPEDFFLDPPPVVRKIFKLFGIKDINSVAQTGENDIIH